MMKINPEKKAISLIIICLIIGSLMAYFSYNHPRSIREIIKDIEGFEPQIPMYPYHDDPTIEPYPYVFTFRTIKPGTVIPVGGEVTDLEIMHTTYGKLPVLILDHCDDWPVFGKPDKNYKIGEYEVIDFHFREYYYNQDKFVWADELFGIFPAIPIAISIVMKGVSYVGGIHLEPTLLDNEGLTKYVINTHYKFDYPLTLFNASLRKGSHSYAIDYVEATCGYENVIAKIDNLNDTKNENSLLKFYDSNRSGFLDTGDYFVLNLPPTKDRSRFDTYILFINDYSDDCIFMGLEYIINWYAGIFHISEIEMPFEAEDHDLYSHYSIKLISDQKNNSFRDVTLKISNVSYANGKPEIAKYEYCTFNLNSEDNGTIFFKYHINPGVPIKKSGITIIFSDMNENGFLDIDDQINIFNLNNNTQYDLHILKSDQHIGRVFFTTYIANLDYGPWPTMLYFNEPKLIETLENNTWEFTPEIFYGPPIIDLDEFSHYTSVQIFINDELFEVDTWDFGNGSYEIGDTGRNFTFIDMDRNNHISYSDKFRVECESNSHYKFELNRYDGPNFSIEWET